MGVTELWPSTLLEKQPSRPPGGLFEIVCQ